MANLFRAVIAGGAITSVVASLIYPRTSSSSLPAYSERESWKQLIVPQTVHAEPLSDHNLITSSHISHQSDDHFIKQQYKEILSIGELLLYASSQASAPDSSSAPFPTPQLLPPSAAIITRPLWMTPILTSLLIPTYHSPIQPSLSSPYHHLLLSHKASSSSPVLNATDLSHFLTHTQGEKFHSHVQMLNRISTIIQHLNEQEREELIDQNNNQHSDPFQPLKQTVTMDQLLSPSFLLSPLLNTALGPHTRTVHQSMDKPLSDYFVASSHNTYLEGNQFTGHSTLDAYKRALKEGFKMIEIDCWDGPNNEPIVYHGYTMTSKLSFQQVIECIKQQYTGFTAQFPLILSLEIHCSVPQQLRLVHHLKSLFGDSLESPWPSSLHVLPSPNALKGKILLQGKMATTAQEQEQLGPSISHDKNVKLEVWEMDHDSDYSVVATPPHPSTSVVSKSRKKDKAIVDVVDPQKHLKVGEWAKDLYELLHFRCMPSSDANDLATVKQRRSAREVFNLSEGMAADVIKKKEALFKEYHSDRVTRIYPSGLRIDSSNFHPTMYWREGCQWVSLNVQVRDAPMRAHEGLFMENGGSGYLLRPSSLFHPGPTDDTTWKVKVLSVVPRPEQKGKLLEDFAASSSPVLCSLELSDLSPAGPRNLTAILDEQHQHHSSSSPLSNLLNVSAMAKKNVKQQPMIHHQGNAHLPVFRTFTFKADSRQPASSISLVVSREVEDEGENRGAGVRGGRILPRSTPVQKKQEVALYASAPISSMRQGFRVLPAQNAEGKSMGWIVCQITHVQ